MAKEHEITEAKVRIGGDGAKMSRIASFVVLSFSLLGDEESIMSAYGKPWSLIDSVTN